MNRTHALHIGIACTALLLLSACTYTAPQSRQTTPMAPCTASGSVFATKKFSEWPKLYHAAVSEVVEAHLTSIEKTGQSALICNADDYASVLPPSEKLIQLASALPAWKPPERLRVLSEIDTSSILMEFLRVYECSLNERRHNLPILLPAESEGAMDHGAYIEESEKQKEIINDELALARPALERTLAITGGYDRMRPLAIDIECLKRTSLDLRNVLGLTAEVSACMPRAIDAHGSLRDLAD